MPQIVQRVPIEISLPTMGQDVYRAYLQKKPKQTIWGQLGMFEESEGHLGAIGSVQTDSSGYLQVLPSVARNAPPVSLQSIDPKLVYFGLPNYKVSRAIQIQGGPNLTNAGEIIRTTPDLIEQFMREVANAFYNTKNLMAYGAMMGQVLDGAGRTVVDFNQLLGYTPAQVSARRVLINMSASSIVQQVNNITESLTNIIDYDYAGFAIVGGMKFMAAIGGHPEISGFRNAQLQGGTKLVSEKMFQPEVGEVIDGVTYFRDRRITNIKTGQGNMTIGLPTNEAILFPIATQFSKQHNGTPPVLRREGTPGLMFDDGSFDVEFTVENLPHNQGVEVAAHSCGTPIWSAPQHARTLVMGS